jgi:hypothetical protein
VFHRATLAGLASAAVAPPVKISLRWILLHLLLEYGRQLGQVDLIREAVDGSVGI